ncbi:MAG: thymidylate synthase [Candidatus Yanofskybacteria bacterium]|nr:thymidylate synthase [Candidatus Yanofskybacteria bacterium]
MRQYLDVLKEVIERGVDKPNRTGVNTRALFLKPMRFDLRNGFPAITTKKLAFKSVKAELLWFLEGSSDDNRLRELVGNDRTIWTLNAQSEYWKPKARFNGDLGRIYGVQWRSWRAPDGREIDQFGQVIERIKNDPYNRRLVVTAWNPGELDNMALPPCHMFYQFFVSPQQELSLAMYQRSCDMFLGVPFNIASYALLLHMVAQVTSLEPHELIIVLADTHIYHNHLDQVREQLSREPLPLPRLWLNSEVKDINKFTMNDIELVGYEYHPSIKAEMAV